MIGDTCMASLQPPVSVRTGFVSRFQMFVVGAMLSSAAVAQSPPFPVVFTRNVVEVTGDTERRIMADFAQCALRIAPRKVEKALALQAGAESMMAIRRLANHRCLKEGHQMTIRANTMRGVMFAALYRRREAVAAPISPGPAMPKIRLGAVASGDDNEKAYRLLVGLAGCVVDRDLAAARRLVLAQTASPEEQAAFQAVSPILADCLPTGTTLKLNKTMVEGALAEVLYRGIDEPEAETPPMETK